MNNKEIQNINENVQNINKNIIKNGISNEETMILNKMNDQIN